MTHREWKAEAEKQLTLRGWTRKDLAKQIHRSHHYVSTVMSGTVRSRIVVAEISRVLGIEPYSE